MIPQQRSRLRASTRPLFLAALALLAVIPGPTGAQQRPQSHKSGSSPTYRDVLGRTITLGAIATTHGTLNPGPADPTTLFTSGFDRPWGMAAGSAGDLYVVDLAPGTVSRVAPDGTVSTIASGMHSPFDIVVDGFGKLLVTEVGTGKVLSLDPETGEQSVFASGLSFPLAITVGPDGDVWVAEGAGIGRFDPDGNRLETIGLGSSSRPVRMAFSPEGVLHYSVDQTTIHRVENGAQSVVLTADRVVEGIAFDEHGFLYIVNGFLGRVDLYDASYQLVGPVDEERFLDLIGNRNGRLDLGDYLLFLRDQGILALTLTSPITN